MCACVYVGVCMCMGGVYMHEFGFVCVNGGVLSVYVHNRFGFGCKSKTLIWRFFCFRRAFLETWIFTFF